MSRLTNSSNSDFGCTSIEVSRAGNSAQAYNGSVLPAFVLDKTFTITPATSNPSSNNTIAFYFTEAELSGWENLTGSSRNNLGILKDDGVNPENVSATTLTAFGNDFKLEGSFTTGIKGTYYFGEITVLSTNDFNLNNGLSIYPNPVTNELNIAFNNNLPTSATLHNMLGQVILSKVITTENDLKINTSNLSTGMYFINIKTDATNQTFKFLKK